MKNLMSLHGRTIALASVLILLAGLLGYVALRAGPMAPIPVTVISVESQAIKPALFGIGSVEARFTHKIGPTFAGRVKRVEVQSGDHVAKGQLLGEMDPVDLDDKIGAQEATLKRAEATLLAVEAQVQEVSARKAFAEIQTKRYEQLLIARSVSEEGAQAKQQELDITQASLAAVRANLEASRQELIRARADRDGLVRQRANLRLISPVDGIVTRRDADPGTTVVAGQAVVEVVEPGSIWINVRFDQQRAQGLSAQLSAQIVLRSRAGELLTGRVLRTEPHADAVTEEILAKVAFTQIPQVLPSIGELAEVTVALAAQKSVPVVPNAGVQRVDGRLGVWVVEDGSLRFAPIKTGATDLEGRVQILQGLSEGEKIVVYSFKALDANSRIKVVDRIVGKSS
ncbi:MAG: efflux RND transporter periplasmic adaptor subunit [Betaproteobacteria bacterium]|nr:efflux RND transporter periplasmic adaptor subunit [Betaproteobacteria bacterium]